MSPILKTATLAIIALATSAAAAYFYPWPTGEAGSNIVGQPIFEDYASTKIKQIRIDRFNVKTGKIESAIAKRKGDRWLLPNQSNFEASNARHIALVSNSLLQREVLEERSKEQEDHSEYGVIDPTLFESTANKSALGVKLALQDANGRSLANLVIGKQVGNTRRSQDGMEKRFVAIPGQPNVYVIDFNPAALTTQFEAWVDPNLFSFTASLDSKIEFTATDSSSTDTQTPAYQMSIGFDAKTRSPSPPIIKIKNNDSKLEEAELNESTRKLISIALSQFSQIRFIDVQKKQKAAKDGLSKANQGDKSFAVSDFDSLKAIGFVARKSASKDSAFPTFEAARGSVAARYSNGLVVTMLIGNSVTNVDGESSMPSHHSLMIASVDESIIPSPTEPTEDQDEAKLKAYLLAKKQRTATLQSARVSAIELNGRHANWVYLVPTAAVDNLLPEIE